MSKTPPSQEKVVRDFIAIMIKKFREAETKYKVRHTGALFSSFTQSTVKNATGKIISFTITFKKYLRYLDMGVGRGTPIGGKKQLGDSFYIRRNDKGQLHQYNRTPNTHLYSKIKTSQAKALAQVMKKQMGEECIGLVETNLNNLTIDI
jgi:hypothetical protein